MLRQPSKVRSIRARPVADLTSCFEPLERRQLLSSATINFANFSSTSGLTANGFGSTSPNSNGQLVMTDSQADKARSVFLNRPVPFDRFTTHFSYQVDSTNNPADGLTFALQENGPTALGAIGGSLGYQNMGGNSVGVAINIYGGRYELFNGNSNILNPFSGHLPFGLANGDTYDVTVSYDGTTLTTTLVDQADSADTFTDATAIDLHSALGASTAYIGFTGATGSSNSTQRILDWNYSGNDGLTITTPAASAGVVTARSASLSVAATDITNGGALTYAWSILHKPSGAADPTFTANNSAAADNTTAHFSKDGTYIFRATAANTNGLSDVSDVEVVVHQTATAIRVSPHAQRIARHGTQACTAKVTDQFGRALRTQPTIVWSLLQGPGSIDAGSGLFTASSATGHIVIEASDALDSLTGTIGAAVS